MQRGGGVSSLATPPSGGQATGRGAHGWVELRLSDNLDSSNRALDAKGHRRGTSSEDRQDDCIAPGGAVGDFE